MQAAINVRCRHPRAATQWTRLLLRAAYGLQHTNCFSMHCQLQRLSIFFAFVPDDLDL